MAGFTKKAIKEAFLNLLNEQPLNKISVRDIVEECGINRNSFYYHFKDIPALIEEIVTEFFDTLISRYPSIASIEECFSAAFSFTLENRKAMLHIYNSVNRDIYEKYLMQFCEYAVTSYLDTAFGGRLIGEPDRKMIIRILKCELFGAYIEWVSMGMPRDAINEVSRMLSILHGLSEEIILRCRQDGETPSVLRDVTDKG